MPEITPIITMDCRVDIIVCDADWAVTCYTLHNTLAILTKSGIPFNRLTYCLFRSPSSA